VPEWKHTNLRAIQICACVIVANPMHHTYKEVISMPLYQQLLFGCANPRFGLANGNSMSEVEMLWNWIGNLAGATSIVLDWPAATSVIAPLASDQTDQDDILGVVVAISEAAPHAHERSVALLGELISKDTGPTTLAKLCMPYSADIQSAMLKWEIARFSARGIGLDLPPGRLFLVEGRFDTDQRERVTGRGGDAQ
jgi:hypothetical protein